MYYKIKDKKELKSILNSLKEEDKIEVPNLDTLGVTVYDIGLSLKYIQSKKASLKIGEDIDLDFNKDSDYYNMTFNLATKICELQSKRVKDGLLKAKESGKSLGRNKLAKSDLPEIFLDNIEVFNKGFITKMEFSKLCNCSRPTLDKWIKCYNEE